MSILPTFSVPTLFRIQSSPPATIKDRIIYTTLVDVYSAINQLIFIQQPGQTQGTIIGGPASEAILLGAPVNLFNSGGVLTIRNADSAVSSRPCHGFCVQLSGIAAGGQGSIDCGIRVIQTSQTLVIGQNYWLAPGGGLQTTPDTAAGHLEQYLGVALSPTQLLVKSSNWVQH